MTSGMEPVIERMNGLRFSFGIVVVLIFDSALICLMKSRYWCSGMGLYPSVFRLPVVDGVSALSTFGADDESVFGSKKVNWWMLESCGKPSSKEVRVVTAPV